MTKAVSNRDICFIRAVLSLCKPGHFFSSKFCVAGSDWPLPPHTIRVNGILFIGIISPDWHNLQVTAKETIPHLHELRKYAINSDRPSTWKCCSVSLSASVRPLSAESITRPSFQGHFRSSFYRDSSQIFDQLITFLERIIWEAAKKFYLVAWPLRKNNFFEALKISQKNPPKKCGH